MSKNTKINQKGEDNLEFELMGGSEKGEMKYKPREDVDKEADERSINWLKKHKIKLGKATLLAFKNL